MKKILSTFTAGSTRRKILAGCLLSMACFGKDAKAQGMHFSQYYNAPMLLNPANTGLMSDFDYRLGANYRNQWASVPVPYKTFSAYGDFQAFRQRNQNNWLGAGLAFYNDKAGNGDLSLTRMEALLAYHIELGSTSMISAGLSGSYNQRSVDFSKLTFDMQWDGMTYNTTLPNGEKGGISKTSYLDVGAGANYAFFPNERVYVKIGAGVAHINQPKESFYGMVNRVGIRPMANVDGLFKVSRMCIINPSVYYAVQKGASELTYGTLFSVLVGGDERSGEHLMLGAYHRWDEAIIAAAGFDFGGFRLMASYDVTISKLANYNNQNGGFEIGLSWKGLYSGSGEGHSIIACPRF